MPKPKHSVDSEGRKLNKDGSISKKQGRKRLELNEASVYKLAQIGCTYDEMATILACDEVTLRNNYSSTIKEGWSDLNMSLRRSQVILAKKGNATMQIWLGKQRLGQREPKDVTVTQNDSEGLDFDTVSSST
jgi:hypothetical protein